jgi:hypothetical protein
MGGSRQSLAAALHRCAARKGGEGFTFADLLRAGRPERASLSDLTAWLAQARATGAVEDVGFEIIDGSRAVGPRRYRATRRPPSRRTQRSADRPMAAAASSRDAVPRGTPIQS